MAIGSNSYSSVAEVTAMTRHLLDGNLAYDGTTRPTITEVEKFVDRVSAELNTALAGAGFSVPVTNATAVLLMDSWVTANAAVWVELTQRGVGYTDVEEVRTPTLFNMYPTAREFIAAYAVDLERLGESRSPAASAGLAFTGDTPYKDRSDPDNTGREQPMFRRRQWDSS